MKMKNKKFILAITLLALGLTGCGKEGETNRKESSDTIGVSTENNAAEYVIKDVLEENQTKLIDLNLLTENLEKNHKNLYANISKEEFEAEKQKIIDKLKQPMTDSEFYYELKHLTASIQDSHTTLNFSESQYKHLRGLGFAIQKYDTDWYLMMLEEQNQQYLGYQLIAINNVDIKEIYERAKSIISHENEAWMEQQFSNTINFFDALKYLEVVKENEEIVLYVKKDASSEAEKFSIKPMTETEILSANIIKKKSEKAPQTVIQGIYSSKELTKDVYYIQYNQCQEAEDFPMKDFVEYVKEQFQNNPYKKVIVDLRYNSGGNSVIFEPMIKELKRLQEEYNFEVYTLIGSSTFSSAIINAIQLKEATNCILMGSPTGGNVNGYGELQYFNLQYMPVTVYYSTKYFELIQGYEKDSLYPDIMIPHTFEDYKNGIDREIQTILEME